MTALGLIKDVKRTLFIDESLNKSVYPLDEKINLKIINGARSRYTQVFSNNAARIYAGFSEEESSVTFQQILGISIQPKSLTILAQAVSDNYLSVPEEHKDSTSTDDEDLTVIHESLSSETNSGSGFIAERLAELDAHPDRDAIIQAALDGNVEGSDNAVIMKKVVYAQADGTGVPGLKKELSAKGKTGGAAKTFEAKIGSVFQQGFDAAGLPILSNNEITRLPGTTKYTGTVNKIDLFTPQFSKFTKDNGIDNADQIVFLADGAAWLWNMQKKLFPNAVCIIDFFHATEHLNDIVDLLCFSNEDDRHEFRKKCRHLLELGDIGKLEEFIKSASTPSNEDAICKRLSYFTDNADKMRYGLFKAAGLFIGSGVIEAACKTIVGKRMKNAGMHWSKKNAQGVIALRCAIYSGNFDSVDTLSFAA